MRRLARLAPTALALLLGLALGSCFRPAPRAAEAGVGGPAVVNAPPGECGGGRRTFTLQLTRAVRPGRPPVGGTAPDPLGPDDWVIDVDGASYWLVAVRR